METQRVNSIERPQGIMRRSLHHEVVEKLRDLILSGDLAPRSRVNEVALCERFEISRTPLREAIKLLAAEGLLDLLPNRGARIAALSASEIEEILQVVGVLEALAGELACKLITEEEMTALETANADMVEAWKTGDYPRYFKRNQQIHEAIIAAAGNSALEAVYRSLSGRVQRARFSAHKTDEQWKRAIDDHNLMIIFLRRRDGAALAQLMREHIKSKKVIISAAYSAAEKTPRATGRRSQQASP
jgi:DNA-binding GntR family transcriptional regulator